METLDLKKAIKELKKQIKEKEKRCEEIEILVANQKEKDDYDKEVDLLNLEDTIDKAYEKSENARKICRVTGPISAGLVASMLFSPVLLGLLFPNLIWLPFTALGLSLIAFIPSFIIYTKKDREISKQKNIIKDACNKKDRITLEKSEKLHVLEMEMDIEYNILRELNNDYRTLIKYARKKEPEKIAKGKIEVRKAKTFKEKVDKKIEEDTNLLNK